MRSAGLTDYEVRDLNDEINRLMREKRHWENQIIALGGANYRRNVAMLDDDGKEVPGTKGYKSVGSARAFGNNTQTLEQVLWTCERPPGSSRAVPEQEKGGGRGESSAELLQEVHKPRSCVLR